MYRPHKYKVDQAVLDTTTECPTQNACLTDPDFEPCQISPSAYGEVLFIERECGYPCRYKHGFGDSSVCTCPTRKAIYEQSGA